MGATDDYVQCVTFPAGGAIAATEQFKFVEMNSSGQVTVANALTDIVVGVLYGGLPAAAAGDAVTVAVIGKAKVKAGAAIAAAGVYGATDATGRLITGVATNRVAGLITDTAAAAGEMATVLLIGAGSII